MIGYREEGEEDKLYVIGNNASSWLVNKLIEDSAIYGVKISLLKILDDRWRYSDHASFWDQEYVAVCLFEGFNQDSEPASLAVNPYHHTVNDTWKALRLSQIAKASKLTIAAIAELAGLSSSEGGINLQYLGHSAFVLTTSEGHEIWMDHSSRSGYTFYFPNVVPDLVTVTHNHYDHRPWTWTGFIFIDPESEWGQKFLEWKERVPVLMGVTGLNNNIYHQIDKVFDWGLRVYTVETKHYSRAEDSRRGRNAVFVYEVKGLRIVHLGYLGHLLTESQINPKTLPRSPFLAEILTQTG